VIILDTNVISELVRAEPNRTFMTRIRGFRSEKLCTTAITEAELRAGLERLPEGRKSVGLKLDIDEMLENVLGSRILPFDTAAAKAYAVLLAKRIAEGRAIGIFDIQIAGIVQTLGATFVTRNTTDFEDCGFEVINPWK